MPVSNVTLLTYGAQTETASTVRQGSSVSAGTSTPLDTSLNAALRVAFRIDCNLGTEPEGEFYVESGPSNVGPWTTIAAFKMNCGEPSDSPQRWIPNPRAVVAADTFTRVRWTVTGTRRGTLSLSLGCSGTAMP